MRLILACALSLTISLVAARAAAQQGAPAPAKKAPPAKPPTTAELDRRLAALEAEIAELRALAAELPGVQKTLDTLAAQVAALRQDVDALSRGAAGQGELVARVDKLEARLTELGEQVAALRADVAGMRAPENAGGGGGGGGGGRYEKGFHLVDGDAFSLRTTGYLQLRFTGQVQEAFDSTEVAGFSIRRARLSVDGRVWSPRLSYKMMVDFATTVVGLDLYVEGALPHGFWLRGGQFKVPFSRDFMTSANVLAFPDRPVATDELRYDRDIGLWGGWVGAGGRVEAGAGVFNGAGRTVKGNDNIDPLLVVRVEGTPLGKPWKPEEGDLPGTKSPGLTVGVSGTFENAPAPLRSDLGLAEDPVSGDLFDVDGDGDRDNVRVMQVGVDAAFRWRGLGVEGELYLRQEDWGAIADPSVTPEAPEEQHLGWFGQATYYVLPQRLQVGLRVSQTSVSPLVVGGRTHSPAVEGEHRRELSALLAYRRFGHGTVLAAQYSFLDWYDDEPGDLPGAGEQRLIVQAQVAW